MGFGGLWFFEGFLLESAAFSCLLLDWLEGL